MGESTYRRANLERTVVAAVEDLMFKGRISSAAEELGIPARFPRNRESLLQALRESPPDLLIIDLFSPRFEPLELLEELGGDETLKSIPTVGFLPHVEGELAAAARRAGCDRVMARGAFVKELSRVLKGERVGR